MLKLVQIDNGVFDLAADDPAARDDDAAVATLVYAALFTDARAPRDRVDGAYARKGWWEDPEAGSGLWYVRWQALSDQARIEAFNMVRQALARHAPDLADIEISDLTTHPGNVSSVILKVTGTHNGRKFIVNVPL